MNDWWQVLQCIGQLSNSGHAKRRPQRRQKKVEETKEKGTKRSQHSKRK
ncbi:hypothetical protein MHI24_08890 [Paenibacillus sp. FSL K6-1096]